MKSVVLVSGGLDSTTVLYYARSKGYKCYNIIFDYGQRHRKEIIAAEKISKLLKCPYYIIKINFPWQGSVLLNKNKKLPVHKINEIGKNIPTTYVPARNTIFISFAVSFAETINAKYIFIGANSIDYSGYPDCRQEYFMAFNKLISIGTKNGVEQKNKIEVIAPFVNMKKSEIIQLGLKLKVPFQLTWSCYEGKNKPCMKCDSCKLRNKAFKELGINDPLLI